MSENKQVRAKNIDDLYADTQHYHVNTGGETIHAKRMPGRFRNLTWLSMSLVVALFYRSLSAVGRTSGSAV